MPGIPSIGGAVAWRHIVTSSDVSEVPGTGILAEKIRKPQAVGTAQLNAKRIKHCSTHIAWEEEEITVRMSVGESGVLWLIQLYKDNAVIA